MTMRDLSIRLAGVGTIGAGWGACQWLRALMLGPPHDPSALEFLLVLLSFVLTLAGALLVLNGEKLLRRRPSDAGSVTPFPDRSSRWDRQPSGPFADDRAMLADVLARRASRRRKKD